MQRLKERWGIESTWQLSIIFMVFAITGSASVFVARPFLDLLGLELANFPETWWSGWVYWTLRLLLIFPFYQILLLVFAWIFGQFDSFRDLRVFASSLRPIS